MTGNLTPIAYTARNASVPQQAGALRLPEGFAPRPEYYDLTFRMLNDIGTALRRS